jgi:hypothetical protein
MQHSNLATWHDPELPSPAPLRCGKGKGHPNSVVRNGCAHIFGVFVTPTHPLSRAALSRPTHDGPDGDLTCATWTVARAPAWRRPERCLGAMDSNIDPSQN